jgi:hypothetical protein
MGQAIFIIHFASWNFLFQHFHPSIRELRLDPRRGFVGRRVEPRERLSVWPARRISGQLPIIASD